MPKIPSIRLSKRELPWQRQKVSRLIRDTRKPASAANAVSESRVATRQAQTPRPIAPSGYWASAGAYRYGYGRRGRGLRRRRRGAVLASSDPVRL